MLVNALSIVYLALFLPLGAVARQHGPSRLDKRHPSTKGAPSRMTRRGLNDAPGKVMHVALKRAPASTAHPKVRFLAHQAHALVRHARAVDGTLDTEVLRKRAESLGQPIDLEVLRKRAMPIGMNGHHHHHHHGDKKKKPADETRLNEAAVLANTTSTNAGFSAAEAQADVQNTVTQAIAPTTKNTVGLNIEAADVGYFGAVSLGTPAQTFQILFDSGSADFWVPSQACTQCGTHKQLGSKTSSSFKAGTKQFEVSYGTGQVAGVVIQDDVSIAGLQLKNHQFGVALDETDDFSSKNTPFDGIMGLALSKLSEQGVQTPIESLAAAGVVSSAQMGYKLGRVGETNNGQATFGGVDATKFKAPLTLLDNISKTGFWEAAVTDVTVNGQKIAAAAGRSAIVDTGTTLIVAPTADATAVHALIPGSASDGQGGFTVPCTTNATVALTMGGVSFSIAPQDLAFLPVNLNDLTGDCQSGISAGQVGGAEQWLVGDVFLKNNYFATDVENNQLGLAASI